MRDDLRDALVPVKWAEAQIPILHDRLKAWNDRNPYEIVPEEYPDDPEWETLVAYLEKPLDPLIVGDIGAIINSVRTALNLLMAAILARHGHKPKRAVDFPICVAESEFLRRVNVLEIEYGLSPVEAGRLKNTRAFNGGDRVLFHIATLDNMRKHERLLRVEPSPLVVSFKFIPEAPIIGTNTDDKSILCRIRRGQWRFLMATKTEPKITPEIFLNEATTVVGRRPALVALNVYISRVKWLIMDFP